ncbi:hypothetical protein ACFLWA_11295 [Chloroflexota bacterium]
MPNDRRTIVRTGGCSLIFSRAPSTEWGEAWLIGLCLVWCLYEMHSPAVAREMLRLVTWNGTLH